ncbi:pyridoxal 5'-phosphate synthase subunit PdxS-like isoform X1 [Mercenaria mercenaria]|uniref:pyridoxal 5'-phosphate synthase subunit PdxS-like isoform X1 n=1 Tax=Mercenaria mercenaria TaxID=6596 RepID=UPI001E1E0A03|nr:pyridoxal 5'-phosphate synthase subunit PdxS-like isoform X1 [Mercenaria mercenaria]XP_053377932.1 pyridoxal 5'-phosphate synthase subunit PdxS-like isoform X1 [Mercenaria mercenaria]
MALVRVPADIHRDGGVARMSDPQMIKDIIAAVTIPVMAKARIGHFADAQILEALGVDMVDKSEVLNPSDEEYHIDKHNFKVPFFCGARDPGEALRRIAEGAAMIRTKGLAGTGDVAEAVRHARTINKQIKIAQALNPDEIYNYAKELRVPIDLLQKTTEPSRLPVLNFAAGGIATPADVYLMMQLGADGVFFGSGVFKSTNPAERAVAMAQTVTHYKDAKQLGELSSNLGQAMTGVPRKEALSNGEKSYGWSVKRDKTSIWNATLGDPEKLVKNV